MLMFMLNVVPVNLLVSVVLHMVPLLIMLLRTLPSSVSAPKSYFCLGVCF